MKQYSVTYPNKIIFGNESFLSLSEHIPENAKILFVTGKSALKGNADKILNVLLHYKITNASGMTVPEPHLECVDKLINLGRCEKVDTVIALGGGSTIDAAKAAAALIPLQGKTKDYFTGKKKIPGKGLFFIALPTTAGTGAEITNNSVLTDKENKVKKSLRHPSMIADIAIIDPILTLDMPSPITAYSGLDALTQAIESYTSAKANSLTRSLAGTAVKLLFNNIYEAYSNGTNLMSREKMAEGSMLSAMAFSQSGLGAVHGLAHPIGSLLSAPHGKTCAIILPHIMRFNLSKSQKRYSELANICDFTNAEDFIIAIEKLCQELKIPNSLKNLGLNESHFPFIIKNCRSNSMTCNPRQMSDEEVETFLKSLSN
jgi:alcohol dehydrogenase class IV